MKTVAGKPRLKPLNDFAFQKSMGEPGDELQLTGFLKAALKRTGKEDVGSVKIFENKDLPAEIAGGKAAKLDVLAEAVARMERSGVNIEVQIKNEYNIEKRSLYYWASKYIRNLKSGGDYAGLIPVVAINIIDFGLFPVDDFHTSFHLWEDFHKEVKMTEACEIHFLDMVKFRRFRKGADFTLEEPLNRWMAYLDEESPEGLVEEVLKMDGAIREFNGRMEMIARDPAMLRAYEQYEKAEYDWRSGINAARREGITIGEQRGITIGEQRGEQRGIVIGEQRGLQRQRAAALKLKARGMALADIADVTGLSLEELQSL
jgi:predicted transposase/invertase (TIGR01784 family)